MFDLCTRELYLKLSYIFKSQLQLALNFNRRLKAAYNHVSNPVFARGFFVPSLVTYLPKFVITGLFLIIVLRFIFQQIFSKYVFIYGMIHTSLSVTWVKSFNVQISLLNSTIQLDSKCFLHKLRFNYKSTNLKVLKPEPIPVQ